MPSLAHEALVANPRELKSISGSLRKSDARDAEQLARDYQQPRPKAAGPAKRVPDSYLHVQDNLRSFFGAKVQLKTGDKGKGQILIPFNSDEDLNRLLDLLEK